MIAKLFNLIFFNPLYNLLISISIFLPGHSLAGSIIILTLIVKIVLLPLQHQALKLQKKLKLLEPKLRAVKKLHQNDRAEQAKQIMELYRAHGVNPLASFWTIIIQIPIILALFLVFRASATLRPELLYSFVPAPGAVSQIWFGLVDLTKPFLPLALLVGLSQFFQLYLAAPGNNNPAPPVGGREELSQRWQRQMRYWLPLFIIFAASTLPSAIGLYWLTSNLFAIGHELVVRRRAQELIQGSDKAVRLSDQ